jgi:hypothetical protein
VIDDKAAVLDAYREMYRAMLARDANRLGTLLDAEFSLTHMTGYRQPKDEWLRAVDSGEMLYHAAEERSVNVEVTGHTAVVVGRSLVTATIFGTRGTWKLQLTTRYVRDAGKWKAKSTVATTF